MKKASAEKNTDFSKIVFKMVTKELDVQNHSYHIIIAKFKATKESLFFIALTLQHPHSLKTH